MQGLEPRQLLLECLRAALAAVDAKACVQRQLEGESLTGDWHVVAIGKAAGAMTQGVLDSLGERLAAAIVVTKPGHCPEVVARNGRVSLLESAHPLPDERSLAAGQAVADFVSDLPASARLLFLVSGGASSLVEMLVPGVSLHELQSVNSQALAAGVGIGEINAQRRALSRLKGGGLAVLAGRRRSLALMISDVPADDPAIIGSGLLHAAGHERDGATPAIPYRIVATVRQACWAAAQCGAAHGVKVRVARRRFSGNAAVLGRRFARAIERARDDMLLVWGGESTVRLPEHPGIGGRNQHLALASAVVFAGKPDVALLAAGTDGMDGVTHDAGGLVDGATCERGADEGLDARECLVRADAGTFLEAAGDLVHTGPTLTNVGDLVLGLRARATA